jgi:hypothetical protein
MSNRIADASTKVPQPSYPLRQNRTMSLLCKVRICNVCEYAYALVQVEAGKPSRSSEPIGTDGQRIYKSRLGRAVQLEEMSARG